MQFFPVTLLRGEVRIVGVSHFVSFYQGGIFVLTFFEPWSASFRASYCLVFEALEGT